eukprot:TRINITY_DN7133_c0_g2_i1.p1 TRINITY_DN7133_c0_g2~~TRINITY_DN7133_c0_g2_i1.p1  ORF type:complete len:872 (-),score=167.61 TRINITY_DN7133_c0_g2_i1:98-2713(-)
MSFENPLTDPVALFLIQVMIIITLSRLLAFVFKYIKQPQVVAEVIAGIILGPSVLGNIPNYIDSIFPDRSINILSVFANIGLIFFMFLIGLEVDSDLLKSNWKKAVLISFCSMAFPFALGSLLSLLLYKQTVSDTNTVPLSSFLLFVGVAMSITAFPVLARILAERKLMNSHVGLTALTSAAVNDVVAWILLAAVVSVARSDGGLGTLWTLLLLIAYFLIMVFPVRMFLIRLNRIAVGSEVIKHQLMVIVIMMTFLSAWVTSVIGIHPIFGGFVMGIIIPRDDGFAIYLTERIEDIVVIVLLPLYFCFSGLRTSLDSMNTGKAWGLCILVIITTCVGKIGGTVFASRILKLGWRESFTVGILMNTKGLVELIVLNIGLDVGVLSPQMFTTFVLMALVTTFITTPTVHVLWVRHQQRKEQQKRLENQQQPIGQDNRFTVLLCVSDAATGVGMATIAASMVLAKKSKKKYKVIAIHLREISDRPSTYFFNQNWHNNKSSGDDKENTTKKRSLFRQHTNPVLQVLTERSRALGLQIKSVAMTTAGIAEDIVNVASTKRTDLVLLGWNEPIFGSASPIGSKVRHVISQLDCPVGVLVDNGLPTLVTINKVLFLYTNLPYEKDSLRIARRMARHGSVQVDVLSPPTATEVENIIQQNTDCNWTFIQHEDPWRSLYDLKDNVKGYDLVLVGVDRDWAANDRGLRILEEIIPICQTSILMIHSRSNASLLQHRDPLLLTSLNQSGLEEKIYADSDLDRDSPILSPKETRVVDIEQLEKNRSSSSLSRSGGMKRHKSKADVEEPETTNIINNRSPITGSGILVASPSLNNVAVEMNNLAHSETSSNGSETSSNDNETSQEQETSPSLSFGYDKKKKNNV